MNDVNIQGKHILNTAELKDKAVVSGNARVFDDAGVYGKAVVDGKAVVGGDAFVGDNACVYGHALVGGDAQVIDFAQVYGNASLSGEAQVTDYAKVHGNAQVHGNARRIYLETGMQAESDVRGEGPLRDESGQLPADQARLVRLLMRRGYGRDEARHVLAGHTTDLRRAGIPEERIADLLAWRVEYATPAHKMLNGGNNVE